MTIHDMSQTRLRAWLTVSIWTIAGAGFLGAFFSGGGPGGWPADSLRHLTGAVALGFGFAAYWLALWLTRQRKGRPLVSDERDVQIVARSNQVTLVVVLVGVFAFTIGLWTFFEARGQVPVGWMWLVAYGSVILAFLTSSITTLVLDRGVARDG